MNIQLMRERIFSLHGSNFGKNHDVITQQDVLILADYLEEKGDNFCEEIRDFVHKRNAYAITHQEWINLFVPVREASLRFCRSLGEKQILKIHHDKQKNGTTRSHARIPRYSWRHRMFFEANSQRLRGLIDQELRKIEFPKGTKKTKDRTFISPPLVLHRR